MIHPIHIFLSLLIFFLSLVIASGRLNSKQLEWHDRSNSKRLRWENEGSDASVNPYQRTKGERGLTFINNEAYSLSKKHQKMMWDLYLRKGYAPSLASYDDDHGDLSPSSSGYRKGIATLLDPNSDIFNEENQQLPAYDSLKKRPDLVASRILDNYELKKASRIGPDYEFNEIDGDRFLWTPTALPDTQTQDSLAEDRVESTSPTSFSSILSSLWELLKNNISGIIGRELQETILNTLWSWWTSIVEFATSRGRRAIEQYSLHDI